MKRLNALMELWVIIISSHGKSYLSVITGSIKPEVLKPLESGRFYHLHEGDSLIFENTVGDPYQTIMQNYSGYFMVEDISTLSGG